MPSGPHPEQRVPRLRWRTGAIGCLLPLLALAAILFGVAAFRPGLVLELAEGRRGGWLEWTSAVTVVGVNLPVVLLSLYLAFEAFRFGWRWADEEAARIGTRALIPHGSLLMRRIPWEEIADLRFIEMPRGLTVVPTLRIELRDGRIRLIRGVDNQGSAAERFAALARERLPAKVEDGPVGACPGLPRH